jgi:hypothetical protein
MRRGASEIDRGPCQPLQEHPVQRAHSASLRRSGDRRKLGCRQEYQYT